jgi:hypothetical protein
MLEIFCGGAIVRLGVQDATGPREEPSSPDERDDKDGS